MRRQGDKDPRDPRTRVEATHALVAATSGDTKAMELQAFMDIFHPGDKRTDEMVFNARQK